MAFYSYYNLIKGALRGLYRRVVKFLMNRSSLARRLFTKNSYASGNSEYCFRVWMKHLKYWLENNESIPDVVIEIGSGNSLGVGLAGLLSGSTKFYSLEKTQYWNTSTNLRVFDDLVNMYRKLLNNPIKHENDGIPLWVFERNHLLECLNEDRLTTIRKELMDPMNESNVYIRSIIPWSEVTPIESNSVDLICSHTVLQHVQELESTYASMRQWLKKGGCISHTIDFKSMNSSTLWNGHWTYNSRTWNVVTGGTYLINRAPLSKHLDLLNKYNFKLKFKKLISSPNNLLRSDLAEPYKDLSEQDLTTSGVYFFAKI